MGLKFFQGGAINSVEQLQHPVCAASNQTQDLHQDRISGEETAKGPEPGNQRITATSRLPNPPFRHPRGAPKLGTASQIPKNRLIDTPNSPRPPNRDEQRATPFDRPSLHPSFGPYSSRIWVRLTLRDPAYSIRCKSGFAARPFAQGLCPSSVVWWCFGDAFFDISSLFWGPFGVFFWTLFFPN